MKKIITMFLAFTLIMSVAFMPVRAQSEAPIFICDSSVVMPGEKLEYNIYLAGDFKYSTFNADLNYDTSVLRVDEVFAGDAVVNDSSLDWTVVDEGISLSLKAAEADGVCETGTLFTIIFTVTDDAEIGTIIPLMLSIDSE